MENRIDKKEDESLYQPKIHSERIRALYHPSKRRESVHDCSSRPGNMGFRYKLWH